MLKLLVEPAPITDRERSTMLRLLAMLLIVQSVNTGLMANVSSAETGSQKCNTTRSTKPEVVTAKPSSCESIFSKARGTIHYRSSEEQYCDYWIESGRDDGIFPVRYDVTISFVMFHLSTNGCKSELVTVQCITQETTLATSPYCGAINPSPILLRSCDRVRIGFFRQDMSTSSMSGQVTIEYSIGQNYDDNVRVFDGKSAVYNNVEADSALIGTAGEKTRKPTMKAKKIIHYFTFSSENVDWFFGLLRRALSYREDSGRKASSGSIALASRDIVNVVAAARTSSLNCGTGGNEMNWTPFLLWTALMMKLLGDVSPALF